MARVVRWQRDVGWTVRIKRVGDGGCVDKALLSSCQLFWDWVRVGSFNMILLVYTFSGIWPLVLCIHVQSMAMCVFLVFDIIATTVYRFEVLLGKRCFVLICLSLFVAIMNLTQDRTICIFRQVGSATEWYGHSWARTCVRVWRTCSEYVRDAHMFRTFAHRTPSRKIKICLFSIT